MEMTLGQTLLEPNLEFPLSLQQNIGYSSLGVIFHFASRLYSVVCLQYGTMSNPFLTARYVLSPTTPLVMKPITSLECSC